MGINNMNKNDTQLTFTCNKKNTVLSRNIDLSQIVGGFRQNKEIYTKNSKLMSDFVEHNTEKERNDLKNAYDTYVAKVEKVLKHDKIQEIQTNMKQASEGMS